jgi:hypothetical protein
VDRVRDRDDALARRVLRLLGCDHALCVSERRAVLADVRAQHSRVVGELARQQVARHDRYFVVQSYFVVQ